MDKSLVWKFGLIGFLIVLAVWTLYPPDKTLKPGIDLAGGTSLIYEIDTQGLSPNERTGLAERMITVLRRRIDPANIQNLLWRPQGNTRFEIQMPLASAEARDKRAAYEKAQTSLLNENINSAAVMRALKKPADQRQQDFKQIVKDSNEGMTILNNLASAYDRMISLHNQRTQLSAQLKTLRISLTSAGVDIDKVETNLTKWSKLPADQLTPALKSFLNSDKNLADLTKYVQVYSQWVAATDELTKPDEGANDKYNLAKKDLDKLNLTEEQLEAVLNMEQGSARRNEAIERLKTEFPLRKAGIEAVVAAFDAYKPFQGRLDDPSDIQRMLKGAGILEFRILPRPEDPGLTANEISSYVDALKSKGPKRASDNKFIWCQIESADEWKRNDVIMGKFGDKIYVLASNKPGEVMLHSQGAGDWSLQRSEPSSDRDGRRAIGFTLDPRGGRMFDNITGKNIGRPLCILLDGTAISAPSIQSRISTSGVITGSFSQTEVQDMVNKLNAGSLPARLVEQPIAVKTIGPSLGTDNRDKGIQSGLIGLAAVIVFMAIYYTIAGSIADVALLLNVLFLLAIMAGLRATFTLPGIAGLVLTIGMSVDANVLIYERVREEQQKGCSLAMAVRNGYHRAFSVIFDSNLTTILTAAILYWVASEEIKGFAIVLIIGLSVSLFTSLFVTRTIFDLLLKKRILKDHLFMLRLIGVPKINWMKLRPVFLTISGIFILIGLTIFFTRDNSKNNKYDIEFTGGTSVQINLKEGANLTRQQVEERIHKVGEEMNYRALTAAGVYSIGITGKQYEINTTETNKIIGSVIFASAENHTVADVTAAINKAETPTGATLDNLTVKQNAQKPAEFVITTTQLNKTAVENVLKSAFPSAQVPEPQTDDVVNKAILAAFGNDIERITSLEPKIVSEEKITDQYVETHPELADFTGGVQITCDIARPATNTEIMQRFSDLRSRPDIQNLNWYQYKILNSDLTPIGPNQQVKSFVYVTADPEAAFRQISDADWNQFAENERTKVLEAGRIERSLPLVTQVAPSVGGESKTRALLAIILSFFAMAAYLWIRFGDVRYGIAAITSLLHDVCTTLGLVSACTYIALTPFGQRLLIGDFKIDLAMVAAFLTLVGYSVNDTIVVFDRIRENRRKGIVTAQLINDSINQTMSRTILTSFVTFIVVLIMYIFGGQSTSLRGFNFAMCFGIITGTYSSIAIAAPILLLRHKTMAEKKAAQHNQTLPAAK